MAKRLGLSMMELRALSLQLLMDAAAVWDGEYEAETAAATQADIDSIYREAAVV